MMEDVAREKTYGYAVMEFFTKGGDEGKSGFVSATAVDGAVELALWEGFNDVCGLSRRGAGRVSSYRVMWF
jgi:hypothetical protein